MIIVIKLYLGKDGLFSSMEKNSEDFNILSYFNDTTRCVCYLAFQLI